MLINDQIKYMAAKVLKIKQIKNVLKQTMPKRQLPTIKV